MQDRVLVFTAGESEIEIPLPTPSLSEDLESSASSPEDLESATSSDIALYSSPSTYRGTAYYTPQNLDEGFYTPWGKASFDIGLSYYKLAFGTVGIVALLIFVMPYAIDFVRNVVDEFRDGMN